MKSFLKSIPAIFLMLSLTALNGQIRPQYVFGMNLSTMSVKSNGLTYDAEMPLGFHFGATVDFPLNDNLSILPALLFTAKGTDYEIDNISYSIAPIYLELPVIAACTLGSGAFKITFFTGPYIACGIAGYTIVGAGELKTLNYGTGKNDDLKQFDAGMIFGAGVIIKGLQITAQYEMGLTNLSPVASAGTELKNQVIAISFRTRNKYY
jgi:hypothetical protein